jgi:PTH1 family peptidyl-tRNA hydrolase
MPEREEPPKIVVGLGNPGRAYLRTRHNAGWMALDELTRRCGTGREVGRSGGALLVSEGLWLFKPFGYMNLSGRPLARLCRGADVPPERLLVVVDDLNLPLGGIRLRRAGSSGGHRGLDSVIEALKTEAFPRLRLGIGPCPPGRPRRQFVLSPFEPGQWPAVEGMVQRGAEAALCWARKGIEAAMNRYNSQDTDQ